MRMKSIGKPAICRFPAKKKMTGFFLAGNLNLEDEKKKREDNTHGNSI